MSLRDAEFAFGDEPGNFRQPRVVRGALLVPYAQAAASLGLDPRRMVEEAGLPLLALDQGDTLISAGGFAELLRRSAQLIHREDFGLLVSDNFKYAMLGALGLLMREQPTIRDALETYGRFVKYAANTLAVTVEASGEDLALRPALFGRPPLHDPTVIDMAVGDMVRILQTLLGPKWRPMRVRLTRRPPANDEPYRQRFGRVEFGSDLDGLFVAQADLARRIPNADPALAREITRYIEINGVSIEASLTEQVAALIVELLPSGACSVEHVALRLGVDRRTIHRRLALEGQSFTGLVERRRRELVSGQLGQSDRPLGAVANMLGFSSLSTFSRWHRNAFGGTARQSRGALVYRRLPRDPTKS